MRRLALVVCLELACAGRTLAQAPPPPAAENRDTQAEVSELVNALLGGMMGAGPADGPALQKEVEQAGGIPFRRDVAVDFLNREQLRRYLRELFDEEYPKEQARADERLLRAFDLLPAGTDLRALRARVLEDNVAGFYDDRPGRRRLYAVSEDRSFTPMNQIVLAHEMRHALQDQYADLHSLVSDERSDFDDRRLAVLSLFEGDATLLMERFVRMRLGGLVPGLAGDAATAPADVPEDAAAEAFTPGLFDVPGAPPVVRDQLVQPYLVGLAFARALWKHGGADGLREAWQRPPASTEQVLHPALFFSGEAPRSVAPRLAAPTGARVVSEGVLGELLLRTLLEEGHDAAAAGWGGDGWRLWDVRGKSALAWRSEWDTPADAAEFHEALRGRFARRQGAGRAFEGWEVFGGAPGSVAFAVRRDGDAVELASADELRLLEELLRPARRGDGLSVVALLTSAAVRLECRARRWTHKRRPSEGRARSRPRGSDGDFDTVWQPDEPGHGPERGGPVVLRAVLHRPRLLGGGGDRREAEPPRPLPRLPEPAAARRGHRRGIGLQVLNVVFAVAGVGIIGLLISARAGGRPRAARDQRLPDDQGERQRGARAADDRRDGPRLGLLSRRTVRPGSDLSPRAAGGARRLRPRAERPRRPAGRPPRTASASRST